jgi:hypothetical protein
MIYYQEDKSGHYKHLTGPEISPYTRQRWYRVTTTKPGYDKALFDTKKEAIRYFHSIKL